MFYCQNSVSVPGYSTNFFVSSIRKMACRKIVNYKNLAAVGVRCFSASAARCSDKSDITKVTHTGQIFAEDDYRNARFVNARRYVNENWGIKLIDEVPPKECTERVVCCDGGDEHLGHPKVYINLDKPGNHACGYCGLRFVKKDHHH